MWIKDTEIIVKKGDLTEESTQVIVNAAGNDFSMGGGLALAIKKKGGLRIEEEAVGLGPVEVGESIITGAGKLKAKYVIHATTMGPDFKTDSDKIRRATASSLKIAQENRISSISFPALGCGVGKFSYKDSAKIMAQEVFRHLQEGELVSLTKIVFVLFSQQACQIFSKNVLDYLEHMIEKVSQGPFITVDGIIEYTGGIVLIERLNPPLGWALPGGFVERGESVEEAVKREIKEETNLDFIDFKQLKTYSSPDRDPRFHTVSVVFTGRGQGTLKADSDAKQAKVFELNDLPSRIAFDHRQIIGDYLTNLEKKG